MKSRVCTGRAPAFETIRSRRRLPAARLLRVNELHIGFVYLALTDARFLPSAGCTHKFTVTSSIARGQGRFYMLVSGCDSRLFRSKVRGILELYIGPSM